MIELICTYPLPAAFAFFAFGTVAHKWFVDFMKGEERRDSIAYVESLHDLVSKRLSTVEADIAELQDEVLPEEDEPEEKMSAAALMPEYLYVRQKDVDDQMGFISSVYYRPGESKQCRYKYDRPLLP